MQCSSNACQKWNVLLLVRSENFQQIVLRLNNLLRLVRDMGQMIGVLNQVQCAEHVNAHYLEVAQVVLVDILLANNKIDPESDTIGPGSDTIDRLESDTIDRLESDTIDRHESDTIVASNLRSPSDSFFPLPHMPHLPLGSTQSDDLRCRRSWRYHEPPSYLFRDLPFHPICRASQHSWDYASDSSIERW